MNLALRLKVVSIFSIFGGLFLFAFSNCGGVPQEGGLFAGSSVQSLGVADAADISLTITQDPIFIQVNDIGFNVGGFCDVSTFPANQIVWRVKSVNGPIVIKDRVIKNACVDKRFGISVLFPSDYNYASQHVIEIDLLVKDEQGNIQGSTTSLINITTL